jgi:hypothetical protein
MSAVGEPEAGDGELNFIAQGEWETMVFQCSEHGDVKSWMDLDVRRYDNHADALAGHADVMRLWRSSVVKVTK